MEWPLAYRTQIEWCEPFFTCEHKACATMGNTQDDVGTR